VSKEGLCTLTPIAAGRDRELLAAVADLPEGDESPFAALGGTHFARFVIVPYLKDEAGDQLDATSYLLFAAEFDGPLEPYVAALCTQMETEVRSIWGRCADFPEDGGAVELERYLLDYRIRPGYSVIAYPGATVDDVRESLALQKRFGDFIVDNRRAEPAELSQRWQEKFARGRP
jgi:hypothetical protein